MLSSLDNLSRSHFSTTIKTDVAVAAFLFHFLAAAASVHFYP